MAKRITAFLMTVFLSLAVSAPSFASVATPSNAQVEIPALMSASESISTYSDDGIMLAYDSSDYGSVYLYAQGPYGTVYNNCTVDGNLTIPDGTTNYWYTYYVDNCPGGYVTLRGGIPKEMDHIDVRVRYPDGRELDWVSVPDDYYRRTGLASTDFAIPVCVLDGAPFIVDVSFVSSGSNGRTTTGWMDESVIHTAVYDGLYLGSGTSNPKFSYAFVNGVEVPWNCLIFEDKLSVSHLWTTYRFLDPSATTSSSGSVYLYKGYEYYMYFNVYGFTPSHFYIDYNGLTYNSDQFEWEQISSGIYKAAFVPEFDMLVADVQFGMDSDNPGGFSCFTFYPGLIDSSYIPKTDTAGQSQQTAANTTVIKNVVTNIENVVTNISNQITNMTTTITNAISDSVNQITQNDNQNTDKVIQNENQNTDKITQNDNQNTDKIVQSDKENTDKVIANADENTDKVETAIEKHGNFIIEGLKSLFIPSDDYFKAYFDDLHSWFSEKLGFLMFPIDLILQIADIFLGSSDVDCILTLPSFSIQEYELWAEYSFNLTEFLETHFSFLLTAIRFVTSVALIVMFVQYCERKWEEVMSN